MSAQRLILAPVLLIAAALLAGCIDDTTELKHKLAELEKQTAKQQKDFAEFTAKFAPQKDFSAEVQRLEDQQENLTQMFKTKVEPINMKLEEFREWAQEAQNERGNVAEKFKALEHSVSSLNKNLEQQSKAAAQLVKELAAYKKQISVNSAAIEEINKSVAEFKKDIPANNAKIVEAMKKALPKVKTAAVDEVKDLLAPLEKNLENLKTGVETNRKQLGSARSEGDVSRDSQQLRKRMNELEEIIAGHKAFLLEVGSKVHELETSVRGATSEARGQTRGGSRR
jgi:chromosome segregation ATPase